MSESKNFGAKPTGGGGEMSRLEQMAAQFQQKQMQEKEQKLFQMLDKQQQRAMEKATITGVIPKTKFTTNSGGTNMNFSSAQPIISTTQLRTISKPIVAPGKVRQMFEERRKTGGPITNAVKAGIDKSHPLDPLVMDSNNKIRSVSSKSDPSQVTRARPPPQGQTFGFQPKSIVTGRPIPNRLTPTPPNLEWSTSREYTLSPTTRSSTNRDFIQTPTNPGNPFDSPSPLSRNSSSGSSATTLQVSGQAVGRRLTSTFQQLSNPRPRDENGNELTQSPKYIMSRSTPSATNTQKIPKTTKYKDYVLSATGTGTMDGVDELLAIKMKLGDSGSTDGIGGFNSNSKAKSSPKKISSSPAATSTPTSRVNSTKSTSSTKTIKTPSAVQRSTPPLPGAVPCRVCNRYFVPERIAKHESICKATSAKKRKVFDPIKMRVQGTEAEAYLNKPRQGKGSGNKGNKKNQSNNPPPKKSDWRKKHEDFIATIRAAKVYQQHVAAGGNPADLPPPPPTDTSDYIQCPHCGRKFNEAAANRHIPKCKSIKSNKK